MNYSIQTYVQKDDGRDGPRGPDAVGSDGHRGRGVARQLRDGGAHRLGAVCVGQMARRVRGARMKTRRPAGREGGGGGAVSGEEKAGAEDLLARGEEIGRAHV